MLCKAFDREAMREGKRLQRKRKNGFGLVSANLATKYVKK